MTPSSLLLPSARRRQAIEHAALPAKHYVHTTKQYARLVLISPAIPLAADLLATFCLPFRSALLAPPAPSIYDRSTHMLSWSIYLRSFHFPFGDDDAQSSTASVRISHTFWMNHFNLISAVLSNMKQVMMHNIRFDWDIIHPLILPMLKSVVYGRICCLRKIFPNFWAHFDIVNY